MPLVFEHNDNTVQPKSDGTAVEKYCWILQCCLPQFNGDAQKRSEIVAQFAKTISADDALKRLYQSALQARTSLSLTFETDTAARRFMMSFAVEGFVVTAFERPIQPVKECVCQ